MYRKNNLMANKTTLNKDHEAAPKNNCHYLYVAT